MPNRPAIPTDIERDVLIEAGHRCAVCGEPCPLERAHIVPWSRVKEHTVANLICLCANCHQRADTEQWGEKTLELYKRKPWVLRRFADAEKAPRSKTKVEMTLDMDFEDFLEKSQRILVHTVASYLEISLTAVQIDSIERGSVKVTLDLPSASAERLVRGFQEQDPELLTMLAPLVPTDVRPRRRTYVGTIVGESTSREFRLAVAHETVREQDIIAVDADLQRPDENGEIEQIRIWAKVQRIERLNPLFPSEAGHELAATRTDPFDTVLSLSREMVSAVCQILGSEPITGNSNGRLDHLRYPPKPATSAYRPNSADIARVVLGELAQQQKRALDIATLSNRPDISVMVDGHAIVSRHLAILAMTGAGKSWTARRIIEQLAEKNYPMIIFDPHGDYTRLGEVDILKHRVQRYYAQFPLFNEDAETVANIVSTLGYELSPTMRARFGDVFQAAKRFIAENKEDLRARSDWLKKTISKDELTIEPNMWIIACLAEAAELVIRNENEEGKKLLKGWAWPELTSYSRTDMGTLEGIKKRCYAAAAALSRMERTNQRGAQNAQPLPTNRKQLVRYGGISVVSLAGYTGDFQAMIYSLIANDIFDARVQGDLKLPVLLVLEEAHTFVPGRANTPAEERSISITKQIAQEGRKFGVGLVMISQRPSRLDETTLSQCNSYIIMRLVNPADQNFVRKVIESLGEEEAKMLPDLDVGEALVSGQLINFPVLVRVKPPESKGEREEEDAFQVLEKAHRSS